MYSVPLTYQTSELSPADLQGASISLRGGQNRLTQSLLDSEVLTPSCNLVNTQPKGTNGVAVWAQNVSVPIGCLPLGSHGPLGAGAATAQRRQGGSSGTVPAQEKIQVQNSKFLLNAYHFHNIVK